MTEENKNTAPAVRESSGLTIVFSILGGVVVGALAVWGWYSLGANERTEGDITKVPSVSNSAGSMNETVVPQESLPEQSSVPETGSPLSLSIGNQSAGLQVAVAQVSLPYSGWVVIHEDRDGVPGNALGAARIDGNRPSTTVELLRGTLPGKVYYGLLYRDDGDKLFSLDNDFPIRDASGNPVMVRFETN